MAPWCDRRIVDDANGRTVVHAEDGRDADHVVTITSGSRSPSVQPSKSSRRPDARRPAAGAGSACSGAQRNEGRRAIDERIRHRDTRGAARLAKVAGGRISACSRGSDGRARSCRPWLPARSRPRRHRTCGPRQAAAARPGSRDRRQSAPPRTEPPSPRSDGAAGRHAPAEQARDDKVQRLVDRSDHHPVDAEAHPTACRSLAQNVALEQQVQQQGPAGQLQ